MSQARIDKQLIQDMRPCKDRFQNYISNYGDKKYDLHDFLLLEKITLHDKIWVAVRLMSEQQRQKFAIVCAQSVLDVFEAKYPQDNRPRLAIEAAIAYINTPNKQNKKAAYTAANAAYAAANAAYAAANAASTAIHAAYAAYAANAAYAAVNAAASNAAYAAYAGVHEDFALTIIEAILTKEL